MPSKIAIFLRVIVKTAYMQAQKHSLNKEAFAALFDKPNQSMNSSLTTSIIVS